MLLLLACLRPCPATAAWPADPATSVPVSTAAGGQGYPAAVPDATGGIIVTWDDQRSGPRDIYIQRVDGNGTPRWTAGGVALCTAAGEQYEPKLVSDGAGGAIVTWSDFRGPAFDIYAQRIDSAGVVKWTVNGVAICTATNFQQHPTIVPDGSGGAVIVWDDLRVGNNRIYAQRVSANGAVQWTVNGVVLTNSLAGQTRPVAVSNGVGGAVVAWEDYRSGQQDLYAQRILGTGAIDPAWPAAGRAVSTLPSSEEGLALAPDGSGGAFVAWMRFGGVTHDVMVHRLLAAGTLDPAWPASGRAVVADPYDQSGPALLADGSGGVLVAWDDYRGPDRDIYAHRVLATGALDPAWPASGRVLCAAAADQVDPRIVTDGAGGAIVAWHQLGDPESDIHAQRVTAAGALDPLWPVHGRAICTAADMQLLPTVVSDGAGGAVVAWQDWRSTPAEPDDSDIYAQRVKGDGQLGDGALAVGDTPMDGIALAPVRPNPVRGSSLTVGFTLATRGAASLELLDAAGRRFASREVSGLGAGRHRIELVPDARPRPGVYFVRLTQQGHGTRMRRVVVLD
jgi:hypothetical protein